MDKDTPKTRKESKKDQRQKGSGKDGKYSQKHIRAVEALVASRAEKGSQNVKQTSNSK
jgi:hypothetical protein